MSGVSAAQRRVLEDLDHGGTGFGEHIAATVVPMRCLVRDGLVNAPTRRFDDHVLTDAGRAALAAAREHDHLAHGQSTAIEDDTPIPVDLDAVIARLAGPTEQEKPEHDAPEHDDEEPEA